MFKYKSSEYKLLAVFMILQQVVLWIIQLIPKYLPVLSERRYLIQETYLAIYALVLAVAFLLSFLKRYREGKIGRISLKEALKGELSPIWTVIAVMALISVLATVFSLDPEASLTGRDKRYEGLYAFAGYYLLCAYALKVEDKKERSSLLRLFGYIGVFSAVIGVLSGLGALNSLTTHWDNVAAMPYGNSNFFGSMITMVDALGMGLMVYSESKKEFWTGTVVFILAALATFCCDSSSPVVGNIMVFLLILFTELVIRLKTKDKKQFKQRLLCIGLCVAVYLLSALAVDTLRNGSVRKEIASDIYYADEGLGSDKMFSGRMIAWKWSFKKLPEFWPLGVGPDNFYLISMMPGAPAELYSYDRAHNEYINLMMTQGVFAVMSYIAFLFMLFIPGVKNRTSGKLSKAGMLMLTIFFGYIAQAFFNIATIQVMPYFWIICGLMARENLKKVEKVN